MAAFRAGERGPPRGGRGRESRGNQRDECRTAEHGLEPGNGRGGNLQKSASQSQRGLSAAAKDPESVAGMDREAGVLTRKIVWLVTFEKWRAGRMVVTP